MHHHSQKASVVLVALSCVTVLGIAMVGFLAVSNQAMRLSNRGYAQSVSKHLAEIGLERALAAFSDNTFGSWTRPNATTATLSFTVPSSRYGNPPLVSNATVNLRVERYRDTRKAVAWDGLINYFANDFVWYQGVWYLCTAAPPSREPPSNTSYWKAAAESWTPYANYRVGNIALAGGSAYRCTADHVNQPPPNATYWTAQSTGVWSATTTYAADNVVFSGGTPYRCLQANTGQVPPNTSYWLCAPVIYSEGVVTLPGAGGAVVKTQYRATVAFASLFPNAAGALELVNVATTGSSIDSYNSVLGAYTPAPGTTNRGSSAVLAGEKTSGNAVQLTGTTRVNGYVAAPPATSSPYAPRWGFTFGSSMVTSTPAPTIPGTRVDLSRVSRSPYVPQFSKRSVPSVNLLTAIAGAVELPRRDANGVITDASADGKYYYYTNGSLDLTTGDTLTINAPVVIDIRPTSSADLYIQSSGKIVIANNATASLEVHLGDEIFIGSNTGGGIQNLTLDPKRCVILCTSTYNYSGYHYLWSSLPFYGVIYLPNGYLHLWNSGYAPHIYGALSARNIYFNHVANFHYDTSLRTAVISGVDTPYELAEWRELTDASERIALP